VHSLAGLYVHVPFCSSVCPYCDFAVTIAGEARRGAWAEGVVREAAMYSAGGLEFDTVYFGGGTPSTIPPERLAAIAAGLRRHLDIRSDARWHLEVNPEDVSAEAAAAWKALGFCFVSLGVQSFDDRTLAFLGRRHSAAQAAAAVRRLLEAGFDTVSVDLIYGLAGQSGGDWRRQLELAVGLGVPHLSCYQLTVHDGTVFGRRRDNGLLRELADDDQAELFFLTHELLADAGRPAYEVSNFASAPGHRSRHNLKYWTHAPYLGLGPSAHSFAAGRRWWNRAKLRLWQATVDGGAPPVAGEERPTPRELLLEHLMLGLRTADGIDPAALEQRFGVDIVARNRGVVESLCASGHLERSGGRVRPTRRGLAVADTLARSFDLETGDARGPAAVD
jgi:putative oxygen-independent coproporphyrinogen III oxidase